MLDHRHPQWDLVEKDRRAVDHAGNIVGRRALRRMPAVARGGNTSRLPPREKYQCPPCWPLLLRKLQTMA